MSAKKNLKVVYLLCLTLVLVNGRNVATAGDDESEDSPSSGDSSGGPSDDGTGIFDVTKYGAKGNGKTDDAQAFADTWTAACSHKGKSTTYLIPEGTFLAGPLTFRGPCSNSGSLAVELKGDLVAPPSVSEFPTSAWITFQTVRGLKITGGGTIDGKGGEEAWSLTTCPKKKTCKNMPTSLKVISCRDVEISGIKLIDSKAFNMRVNKCTNMKISDLNITAPEDSPNTDGIHVSDSTGVTISNSVIGVGDDCVSLGDGNTDITVSGITCGPGHGISVGSLGKYKNESPVNGIHVINCSLTGTTNGLRIKTWPGSPPLVAKNMTFENIIMNHVSFPIIIDQNYCPSHHCDDDEPSNVQISDVTYKNITGTSFTLLSINLICSLSHPCENIKFRDVHLTYQETGRDTHAMTQHAKTTSLGNMLPSLESTLRNLF